MNATSVRTSEAAGFESRVEPLPDNKVRLEVTVPAATFEHDVDAAFRKLAREVRIPGFRPGKAPRRLLEAQFGTAPAREQALRDSLPDYYAEAVVREGVDAIAAPELDITAGEDEGDVSFTAVVEVRPTVELEGYDHLRVVMEPATIPDEVVDAQVDALRNRFADLEDSSDPLIDGAFARVDLRGTIDGEPVDGLEVTDYLYEVGSGTVVDGLDEALRGASPGDILEFTDTLPDEVPEHGGREVVFSTLVKGAQRKVLPEADDAWASDASEFDTIAELRADIRRRAETMARLQAQMALRDKVLEAAVALVDIDPPEALVQQEMRIRLEDLVTRLARQGVSLEQYLAASGDDPEILRTRLEEAATSAVKADLALRAVVTAEAIEGTDEELDAEVIRLAERLERKPDKVRRDLARNGGLEAIRSDLARGKALQFLVDHAEVVDEDGNPVDLSIPTPGTDDIGSAGPDTSGETSDDATATSGADTDTDVDTDVTDEPDTDTPRAEGPGQTDEASEA